MTADELRLLSSLLDQGMALPVAERESWLGTLDGEAARLAATLRELLAKQASQETGDLVDRAPAFLAPAGEPRTGDDVGPYHLLRELGRGGMGAVWLAERADGGPKRKVALKLPFFGWAPGLAERFARESQILAGLEHPHIARLYDAGLDKLGRPYMALEYVEGESLDAYCRAHSLPLKARLALLLQVAEAVAFAHSRLVIHRDLKPGNILVTPEGQVRLLDFGVAKLLEGERAAETRLTQLSGRALTPDYASPEQILGEPIGTASDVYSLGVVAFEVLAGAPPYRLKRGTPAELEEAIVAVEPPPASEVAIAPLRKALRGDLDAILGKALKKDPGDRYASVDALAEDWRRFLRSEPVMAQPDTMAYRVRRFARRHRTPLAAGGLVALALVAATGQAVWQAQQAASQRDRALTMASRNEAANRLLQMLLTQAARGGQGFTPEQVMARSERLVESEFKDRPDHRAFLLSSLGGNLQTIGRSKEALALLERAVQAARESGDQSLLDRAQAEHAFALSWSTSGRDEGAKATLRAIATRATAGPEERARAHHYLSSIAAQNFDAKGALEHATEALRWHRQIEPQSVRSNDGSLLASIGGAYYLEGRAAEAEMQFEAALANLDELGKAHSPNAIAIITNFAHGSRNAGDARKSLELSDRTLAASARDAPDSPKPPYAVFGRAEALEYLGRLEEAEAGYAEAAALSTKLQNPSMASNALLGSARVRLAQGKPEEAARFIEQADQLWKPPPGGYSALTRAALAMERGDLQRAITGFEAVVGKRPLRSRTVLGLLGLSEAHLRLGRPAEALAEAQEALALADRMRGGKPVSFFSALAQLAIARAQHAQGDSASARRTAGQALEQLRASVDPAHPAIARAEALANTAASAH